MGITDDDLAVLVQMGERICSGEGALLPELRTRFPGMVLSQCLANDVVEEPFQPGKYFDLHLLDTSSHCWKITGDREAAAGILLALHGKPS